jgi:hypothetical protein
MWVLDATNPTVVLGGGSSCSRSHLKTGATQYTTHLLLWYLQLVPLLEARRAEQVDKLFPGALELGLVRRLPGPKTVRKGRAPIENRHTKPIYCGKRQCRLNAPGQAGRTEPTALNSPNAVWLQPDTD